MCVCGRVYVCVTVLVCVCVLAGKVIAFPCFLLDIFLICEQLRPQFVCFRLELDELRNKMMIAFQINQFGGDHLQNISAASLAVR